MICEQCGRNNCRVPELEAVPMNAPFAKGRPFVKNDFHRHCEALERARADCNAAIAAKAARDLKPVVPLGHKC